MKLSAVLFSCLALLVFFEGRACAYLDPGTGSFVMQVTIAMAVSAGFAIKTFWKQIKSLFSKAGKK